MKKNVIVVTPHPDDETLGCGGTLLKHKENQDNIYWLIVTGMTESFPIEKRIKRKKEIEEVSFKYGFSKVFELGYPAANLDILSDGELIQSIATTFKQVEPNIVYIPYPGDIHSDHKKVFDATVACTKCFRYPYIEKILCYETLSETDFSINPDLNGFKANVFINIEKQLEEKINIMNIYESEIDDFPFPRSEKAITSLAYLRGATAGYLAAEAFMLLKERII